MGASAARPHHQGWHQHFERASLISRWPSVSLALRSAEVRIGIPVPPHPLVEVIEEEGLDIGLKHGMLHPGRKTRNVSSTGVESMVCDPALLEHP